MIELSAAIIYVGTHAIGEGKVDIAREAASQMVEFLEANHPRMAHFEIGVDEDASEMTVIQVHPDEESLNTHLELAKDKIAQAYEFLEGTNGIDIYGDPSESLVTKVQQMAMGAPVRFKQPTARFSRF